MTGDVYYRGGPKGGQVLLGARTEPNQNLMFDLPGGGWARYRLTAETIELNGRIYLVADYVEPGLSEE